MIMVEKHSYKFIVWVLFTILKNRPVLTIPSGFTYIPPKRYSQMQEYCIIFGDRWQETICYFYTQKGDDFMWAESLPNGKVKFVERYEDPMTGKSKKVSCTLNKDTRVTRKTAMQILDEKIQKRMTATPASDRKMTLSDLVDLYREDQKCTVKPSTCSRNIFATKRLMDILGEDTLVTKLNAGYVRKKFNETGEGNGTLNERLTRLKALIRWGYKNDYLSDIRWLDKLDKAPDPQKKERLQDKFLESSDLKKLLGSMTITQWRLMTAFLALSGLRVGEAIALEMGDVDLNARMIRVSKTWDINNHLKTTTKTLASTRDVYIQDELLDLCRKIKAFTLSENLRNGCRSTLFFCDINGNHIEYAAYNKYLKENALRILDRQITPHALRHTHVALMAEAGVDLDTISRRLGHETSRITRQVYYHITRRAQEAENQRLKAIKLI